MGLYTLDRYAWTCDFCDYTPHLTWSTYQSAHDHYGDHLEHECETMIYQRTNGTYFYECDECWWVSPDYQHKHEAQEQAKNCECERTEA